jgi:hypothetical protein
MIRTIKVICEICGKHTTYSYDDKKEPFWEHSVHSVYLKHLIENHPDKIDKGMIKVEVTK